MNKNPTQNYWDESTFDICDPCDECRGYGDDYYIVSAEQTENT